MKWTGWTTLGLGVWLMVAPFALGYPGISTAVLSDGAFGAVIVGLAAWSLAAQPRVAPVFGAVAVVAGLLLMLAPFMLAYGAWQGVYVGENAAPYLAGYESPARAIANDVGVGLAVFVLSIASVVAMRAGNLQQHNWHSASANSVGTSART